MKMVEIIDLAERICEKKYTEKKKGNESKRNRWNIGLGPVKWRKRRRKHNK